MKTFRFILFGFICFIALAIISWLFMRLLNWTMDRTAQWYNDLNIVLAILLIPLFWGAIWGVFKLTAIGMAALLIPVSPDKNLSLYTLGSLSLINCIALIIYYWTREVQYSWKVMIMSVLISGFILDFSASIVLVFSKKESLASNE
jgi:hypothetical protein